MPRATSSRRIPASPSPTRKIAANFAADDWQLLVRLPADVMIAAISLLDGGDRRTVPEGLAGLDAIAAGRGSDSDLVRATVAAIYAEPEDERPASSDPTDRRVRVLADCRRAVEVLRAGADPADAAAYRQWLQQVAVRVCGASRSGGVLGLGAEQLSQPGREYLDKLAAVLS